MNELQLTAEEFRAELGQIVDHSALVQRVILRKGFEFVAIRHPANVYDALVIRNPSPPPRFGENGIYSQHTLNAYVDFINQYGIEKAKVMSEDISFLTRCPSLKHLNIIMPRTSAKEFDFSPLYGLEEVCSLFCGINGGDTVGKVSKPDYSRIQGLEYLSVSSPGNVDLRNLPALKTLLISGSSCGNLQGLFTSPELDTLEISFSRIQSLDGIAAAPKMQCLYLVRNRSLADITALAQVKKTLRALRIQNCPQITDFSVLEELENLEYLFLEGSNVLPSIGFIRNLPKLKTLIAEMRIEDGDLRPCLNLSYAYCGAIRRHYNLKDKELPRGDYFRGNENIEPWRRIW